MAGMFAFDNGPTASTMKRADTTSPVSVRISQRKRVLVEDRIGDAGAECDVRSQVESVGDVVQVAKDLRLGGVLLAPVPVLLKLLVKGVRVVHAFDIASRAGVAVPVPDSADAVRGLEHPDGQAVTAQPV